VDGSITVDGEPGDATQVLNGMWLGASVMAKTNRQLAPFDVVMTVTRQLLHL
jgi:TetR/AcrR family transcriptional repressor of nem operon